MTELDVTNPLAVVVGFFALLLTFLAMTIKFATLGIFGILLGVGLFGKIMWDKNR
jgi:hypothetical protein